VRFRRSRMADSHLFYGHKIMSSWEVEHGRFALVFSEKNRSRMSVFEGRERPMRTCFMDIQSCPFRRSGMDPCVHPCVHPCGRATTASRAKCLPSSISGTAQDTEPKGLCAQVFRLSPNIARNGLDKAVAPYLAQLQQIVGPRPP
jgi:hypothetical protein